MVCRLVACVAPVSGEMDAQLMEATVRIHRHQADMFMKKELEDLQGSPEVRTMLRAVRKACSKKRDAVSVKEILQSITSSKRPKHFQAALNEAVAQEAIEAVTRPHGRLKKKMVTLYRPVTDLD